MLCIVDTDKLIYTNALLNVIYESDWFEFNRHIDSSQILLEFRTFFLGNAKCKYINQVT